MRTPIDSGHFFAGQGALSAVYPGYTSESATRSCGKMALSRRVGAPNRPCGGAHRLFGTTKLRSARLAWPDWRANAGHPYSANRPCCNTMRIPIDSGHFFAGQGALSAVYPGYTSESATRSCGKMALSRRVGAPNRPCGGAHRLFGTTKLRSARLAWPDWRANAGHPHSANGPSQ